MEQDVARQYLQLAVELYGSQAAVCAALGQMSHFAPRHKTGRVLAPPQYNVYLHGRKDVPEWIYRTVIALCDLRRMEFQQRFRRLLDKTPDDDLEDASRLLDLNAERHRRAGRGDEAQGGGAGRSAIGGLKAAPAIFGFLGPRPAATDGRTTRACMTLERRLLGVLQEEAAREDALTEEMWRIAQDGCGAEFAASLEAIARNHRVGAIEIRSRIEALKVAADG